MILSVFILVAIVVALLLWNATAPQSAVVAEASRTESRSIRDEGNLAPTESANAVAVNEGIPSEAPHPPSAPTNALPVWNVEINRWCDEAQVAYDAARTNGVVIVPESRLSPDSAEAIEYVRIALMHPLLELFADGFKPTVDVYDENAMVAFLFARPNPQSRGRVYRVGIIDIKTKTVVRVYDW